MPEQRVIIALPDGPEFVAALFGVLKIGAVVVMVNPDLKPDADLLFLPVHPRPGRPRPPGNRGGVRGGPRGRAAPGRIRWWSATETLDPPARRAVRGTGDLSQPPRRRLHLALLRRHHRAAQGGAAEPLELCANTTACLRPGRPRAHRRRRHHFRPEAVLRLRDGHQPLLSLLGRRAVRALSRQARTPELLFEQIRKHRPTVLVNVPTMVQPHGQSPGGVGTPTCPRSGSPPRRGRRCRRSCTNGGRPPSAWSCSTGSAPPRCGTSSFRPAGRRAARHHGDGGRRVRGAGHATTRGNELPDGEVGWLRVRGNARAIGYWQQMEKTAQAFQGEWYVSGDMIRRDATATSPTAAAATTCSRWAASWLAPQEVENCLLQHPAVKEAAVVGVVDGAGPHQAARLRHREEEDGWPG